MLVKRYGERGGELKSAQRFRFTNLNQTYAKYKDIFRKKLKQKEEGTVQRHFGAAAKAIEAERARHATEADGRTKDGATGLAQTVEPESGAFRMTCSEPERE